MWIVHTGIRDGDNRTRRLRNAHTNQEAVAFNPDSGKANVTAAVGEQLLDWHPDIEPVDESDSDDETDD